MLNKLGAAALTICPPESSFLSSSFFLGFTPLFQVLFDLSRLAPASGARTGTWKLGTER